MSPKKLGLVGPDGETIEKQTLELTVEGGPLARNTKVLLDGEEIPHLTRFRIDGDINDAVRLHTSQVMMVASVKVQVASWEKRQHAVVHVFKGEADGEEAKVYEGYAPTASEALKQVIAKLEEEEA